MSKTKFFRTYFLTFIKLHLSLTENALVNVIMTTELYNIMKKKE